MHLIPASMTSVAHPDNLIVLCRSCHAGFGHDPPHWVTVPPLTTVQRYINHERAGYAARRRAGRAGITQQRSLPHLEVARLVYTPHILNPSFAKERHLLPSTWPKRWLGQPIAAIIKATGGLVRPCQRSVVVTMAGEALETGVAEEVRNKVTQLVNMWSRPDPPVNRNGEPPAKRPSRGDKSGLKDGSAVGAGGAAGKGKAGDIGVRGRCVVSSSDRQLLSHKGTVGSEIAPPEISEKVLGWLEQLP